MKKKQLLASLAISTIILSQAGVLYLLLRMSLQ